MTHRNLRVAGSGGHSDQKVIPKPGAVVIVQDAHQFFAAAFTIADQYSAVVRVVDDASSSPVMVPEVR